MKLSPPKFLTFLIALAAGVLGILGMYMSIPIVSGYATAFLIVGFVLLVLSVVFRGL